MRLARLQVAEAAAPVLAIALDGAFYDVALLETRWRIASGGGDFFTRAIALRAAGLAELEARLRSGTRPTEARLLEADLLPLPPCDTDRASYVQIGPAARAGGTAGEPSSEVPIFQHRDARALVGDGQPVAFPHGAASPGFEVGVAVVLGDDLRRASAREAARAVIGFTLLLDWFADAPWLAPHAPKPPSQLGPALVIGVRLADLASAHLTVRIADRAYRTGELGGGPFALAERLAFVSQHVELRAGDVVGLGRPERGVFGAGEGLAYGVRASIALEGGPPALRDCPALEGWAVRGAKPADWREVRTSR